MTKAPIASAGSRQIFHAARQPMLLVDPESLRIDDINEAACRFYGQAGENLVGRLLTVVSRSSPERLRDVLASVLAGSSWEFAVEHVTASGGVVPVTVSTFPVEVDGRQLVLEVVTERGPDPDARAVLDMLYEATADVHRAIVRTSTEAELWPEVARIIVEVAGFRLAWVAMLDEQRRFAHVASAAGAVAYLDGRIDDLESDDPTLVARALREGRTVVLDGIPDGSAEVDRAGDPEFGFDSGAAVPMIDASGLPFGALAVLDVGRNALSGERVALLERLADDLAVARALMRTAEQLRASEGRFRSIVEQASAGIMVFDQRGRVLEANPAACLMLGYSLADLQAGPPDLIVHDRTPDEEASLRDILYSGAAIWVDRHFRRADREVITVAFQGRQREDGSIEAVVQDVTAERRAQADLRASEAKYRDLVGALQEGIAIVDADGRVSLMNETACELYRSATPDMPGRDARTPSRPFVREDGTPCPPDELPSQLAMRSGRKTERRILGAPVDGGPTRWISTNAVPTGLDADGRPSSVVVSFTDVTELREALARARASEDRVRTLLDEATDGVIALGVDGVVSYANPASERLLALPPGGLIGRSVRELIPARHHDQLAADLATVAAGAVYVGEYPVLRSDGVELATEIVGSRLADGRIELFTRDVTSRKALEVERARLVQAIEQASDAILITDADGIITYVNRAYERMNGYLREEVIGRPPAVHQAPEHVARTAEITAAVEAQGVWAGEVIHRAKDGTRFPTSSRVVALRDPDGRITGRVGIARDISLEREQDARLAQAARLEAIAQLAGGVAHDLNNVLTMIVGHAALLDPLASTPADIAEGVAAITAAAGQAETLTTRLLAFGRRAFLQPRQADLRDLLSDTQPLLVRAAGARVAVAVSPGVDAVPVSLDPNLFEQALLALVVHARDRMPGGGTLRIAVERPGPGESLPGVEAAVLVVSDTGPGMTPDALGRLFEPFAEIGDDAPGLGLAMAHGFVEQSGGRVSATSEAGRGSAFRILLPLAAPVDGPVRLPGDGQPSRTGAATILVAEDETVLREVARRSLQARGYTVLLASCGEEALEVAASHDGRIDLLFSDVVMPGLRGPGLAAAMLRLRPDMRVLLTSGYAEDVIGRRGIESMTTAFLPKPYTPSMLVATVADLLAEDA